MNILYGGTREEMKRLLADAEKLTGVHYDINNLDDVFKAIHAIQVEMGFTGTTAKEAAGTVEGSYNSMKGAWENFLTALGTGNSQKIRKTTEELCDSIVANFRNILPVIGNIFEGVGQVIEEYTGLPVNDLFKGIVGIINSSVIPAIKDATQFLSKHKEQVKELTPLLVGLLGALMAFKALSALAGIIKGIQTFFTILSMIKSFAGLVAFIKGLGGAITGAFGGPVGLAIVAIAGLVTALITLYNTNEKFRDFINGVWNGIKTVVLTVINAVKTAFGAVVQFFQGRIQLAQQQWQAVRSAFEAVGNVISIVFNTIENVITVVLMTIGNIIEAWIQLILLPFQFIWVNFKDQIIAVWNAIVGAVQTAINVIASVIQTVGMVIQAVWSFIWGGISISFRTVWNGMVAFFSPIINGIASVIMGFLTVVQSGWNIAWGAISTVFTLAWHGMQVVFLPIINAIRAVILGTINVIRGAFSAIVNFINDRIHLAEKQAQFIADVMSRIRDAVMIPVNAIRDGWSHAVDTVRNAIDRIRSFFHFNWELPKIKLPHFKIKGKFSLNPPEAPKFSVEWYAKAMDNPYMFTNATLFGAGEAGDEIMYGRQALMRDIKEAVGNQDIVGIVQALNAIALAIEEIAAIFSQIVSSGTNSGSASAIGTQAPQGSSMQTAASNTYGVLADQAHTATQSAQTDIVTSMALQVADIQNTAPLMQIAAQAVYSPISQNAINATGQAKNTVLTNMQMMAIFIASLLGQFQASSYSTFNAVALSATDRTNAAKSSTQTIIIALEGWIRGQYSAFYALGVYTMQGYNNGLLAEKATVVGTTNQLVDAVKKAFRTGLGIASPSKVAFAYGRYTGIGFINGLNSTELGKFTRSTVSDMKGAFAKQKFSADANVNYMDDDSMKEVNWMRKYDGGSVVGGSGDGKLGRFVSNMLNLVNNDSHGYSQSNRWGPDFDCSSSIIYSLRKAGFDTGSASSTHNLSTNLTARGWSRLPYANPKRGDILLNDATHVEMALGGLINAGFHSAHGHPEPGDQAHEAYVGRDPGHWAAILRYKNGLGNSLADAIEEAYNFKKYGFGTMDAEGDDEGAAASGKLSDWVRAALKLTGQSESLASGLIRAAKAESGGNPRAVNNWDINAKLGHPSKGVMQMIDSTFNAYKLLGHGNIWNPIDNIVAAIRYMIARYGSVERVLKPRSKHWYGYAVGSRFISRDQFAKIHAGEAVIRKSENPYANSRGGFVTTALQEGINAVMSDFANKVAVTAAGGMTTVTNNNDMTQNVYFQETPKQPSAFRAELRQAGRSLAFNGN